MDDVIGFILGGGRGAGLYPLTKYRSVPAVSVGGKYRLIDIPISNCINSGMRRIYILTQFLSVSLHRHIANTYKFAPFTRGAVEVLAAQQTNETADWYKGTADALRQNLRYIGEEPAGDVLILSADGLYRMDYGDLVRAHRESGAALTIACAPVDRERASRYGILRIDDTGRILEMVEKPTGAALEALVQPDGRWMANMGLYLIRRDFLLDSLKRRPGDMDLVTQHFSSALATHNVRAFLFPRYWQDIGHSIRAYHESQLALAGENPPFEFTSPEGVIYTHMRNLPASRSQAAELRHTLVSEGCLIGPGARLSHSVIGLRGQVGAGTTMSETVMCGSDRYETPDDGGPPVGVGTNCVIERAVLDKGCRIGANVHIRVAGRPSTFDAEHYCIRDGIVVVPKGAIVPDGTVI